MDDVRAAMEEMASEVDDVRAPSDLIQRGRRRARWQLVGASAGVLLVAAATVPLLLGQSRSTLTPDGPGLASSGPSPTSPSSSEPSPTGLPPGIAAACGRPGSTAEVPPVRLTVRHAECDLTGVVLTRGGAGVEVPAPGTGTTGSFDGPNGSGTFTAMTDARTKDVTFEARGFEQQVSVSGVLVLAGGPPGTPEQPVEGSIVFDSEDGSSGGGGTKPDGTFTLELLPGTYVLTARSPAYNGGRTDCRLELVVPDEGLDDVRIMCEMK